MVFSSSATTLNWSHDKLVLSRGTSQLLISLEHIQKLRDLKELNDFSTYFRTQALVNRPARRVFEAWERKDSLLLKKLQEEMLA